ncbi:response regulator [Desulfonatronovibrio magnus]|uniref:response regulator n=1 Tax=Desulfonatronovibrio magnus TaxID=698827 RepID=UPI000696F9EC|nr:response regulator [Desulfonatronovibrio magnus]
MREQQKILIVDDKQANLVALRQVLRDIPAEVHSALDGNRALALTLEHDFAVAILDVQMPGMDGYELAEILRAERRTSEMPILFVSAVYTDEFHIFKGYEVGAVDFMSKPLHPEWLLSKVRVFLDLHRQREYYRTTLENLGASLAETQDALRRAAADALRQRTTAKLISRLTSLLVATPSEAELEAEFLQTFVKTTGMDRALLLRPDAEGRAFLPSASLGLEPGLRETLLVPDQPVPFVHVTPETPNADFPAQLRRALGVPHLLWSHDAELGQALLVGNAEESAQTRPAFTPEDKVIVTSALRVLGLIDRQRRNNSTWEMLLTISEVLMRSTNGALFQGIQTALEQLCRFTGADRCHLARISDEGGVPDDFHEWRGEGVPAFLDHNPGGQHDAVAWRLNFLGNLRPVYVHRSTTDTGDVPGMRAGMEAAGIQSILLLPLFEDQRLLGFIGMDWVTGEAALPPEQVPLLHLGANIVLSALRMEQNQKLRLASEQADLKAEAAEAASRAKSEFLANMSHEIRTPMNAILGFAQVLEQDATLNAAQAERVRIINRSGNHLLGLINDVLDMSRIEAGKVRLTPHDFSPNDLLDDLEIMFRPRLEARGLTLTVLRESGLPASLHADETKLRQVLVNLLSNALKFTESGKVTLEVRRSAARPEDHEDANQIRLDFAVQDTGPGITAEDRVRIFDAFYQTRSGVDAGGTGLGLPICRRYVEMMGGRLTVEGEPGQGSVFRFDIQAVEADPGQTPASGRRIVGIVSESGPRRVLVVDDDPENRILIHAVLEPVGFVVQEAGSGQEALEIIDHRAPDAVIMDIRMPGMDGREVIRQLKERGYSRDMPIIASTAYAYNNEQAEIMAAGAHAYLRKPFRIDELLSLLGEQLNLTYIYEAAHEPITEIPASRPQGLDDLPKDLLLALHDAAQSGDTALLKELIARVAEIDAETADPLLALTNNFDLDILQRWFGVAEMKTEG